MEEAFLNLWNSPTTSIIFGVTSILCTVVSARMTKFVRKTSSFSKKGVENMSEIQITLSVPKAVSKLLTDGKITCYDVLSLLLTCEDVVIQEKESKATKEDLSRVYE